NLAIAVRYHRHHAAAVFYGRVVATIRQNAHTGLRGVSPCGARGGDERWLPSRLALQAAGGAESHCYRGNHQYIFVGVFGTGAAVLRYQRLGRPYVAAKRPCYLRYEYFYVRAVVLGDGRRRAR